MVFYSPVEIMRMSLSNAMMISQLQMALGLRFWALAGLWANPIAFRPNEDNPAAAPASTPGVKAKPTRRRVTAEPALSLAEPSSVTRLVRKAQRRTV